MAKCIFCENELGPATKPEHILLNALGGRKTTRAAICSECNNTFGGGIDDALTEQVKVLRNMLQLESGTGKEPPGLRNISSGSDRLNFRNDGRPEPVGKPFTVEDLGNGAFKIDINARSEEELARILPHIAAQTGLSLEEVKADLLKAEGRVINRRPDTIHHRLSFGGKEAIRSIVKSCLVLWATKVGTDELRTDAFAAAREYVSAGTGDFYPGKVRMEARLLPNHTQLEATFGPLFNSIYVTSDASGRVIGHFNLYNAVSWRAVLAEAGGTPSTSVFILSNPLDPRIWSDAPAEGMDVPFEWFAEENVSDDPQDARERINKLVEHYFDVETPKEWGRIADDVFDSYGIGENDPIPRQLQPEIFAEISERLAASIHGVPHERELSTEELRQMLEGKRSAK